MEIIANIYDKDLNNVGYLYNVSELVRTHKYREPGKFSMRLPASAGDVGLMMTGFIIVFSDDTKEGYLIETVEPSEDYPNVAEIAGRDLRAIFAIRIIQNMTVDGSMSNRMWWMIHNHAVAPSDSNRALPFVQDLDRSPVGDDIGPAANQQMTGKNLLTALTDTVGQDAYGWRCDLNLSEKTITPVFYRGADRTKTVLFDDVLCTMDSCDYTRDVSKYCNVATVAGEGEGSARKYAGIDITGTASGTFTGFSRRELFVDARDLQSETEDASGNKTTMSDADYTKVLQTRGLEKLKENEVETKLELSVNEAYLTYDEDYTLGDVVSFANHRQIGITGTARVTSVQIDGAGAEKTVKPEFEVLTIEVGTEVLE